MHKRLFTLLIAALALRVVAFGEMGDNLLIRWDLIELQIDPGAPVILNIHPGGQASASAQDNSKITLTGSGTFRTAGNAQDVTGGGTWKTRDSSGNVTGSGTYKVTGFVSFEMAAGTLVGVPGFVANDPIADPARARAGITFLRIAYSDSTQGVLLVSCELLASPATAFEGITVSKGSVDYWNHGASDTVFHVLNP